MAHFSTCATCAVPRKDCEIRAQLAAAVASLGVTSVKHRCAAFVPLLTPGMAVLVQTVPWMSRDSGLSFEDEDEGEPPKLWFRGHFIRYAGTSPVVFVKPGTLPEDGPEEHAFETKGAGFVKAARYRVKPSDWSSPVDVSECLACGAMTALGQACNRDPLYQAPAMCQAHRNSLASAEPASDVPETPALTPFEEPAWIDDEEFF